MNTHDSLPLHILGCGDAFSSGGQNHTSFFLEKENMGILIDCGASTPMALKKAGFTLNDIDFVFISHFHGDHYGGLPYLILEAAKVLKRQKKLTILSPPGMQEKLKKLVGLLYPGSEDILQSFPIHYKNFESGQPLEFSNFTLTAYEVAHTKATLPHGLRLETAGKVLAYSGDTSWHGNLEALALGADLFICECNFLEEDTPAHLSYKTLQQNLNKLKARRIVLTHLGEDMLKKKGNLALEVLQDGQKIIF